MVDMTEGIVEYKFQDHTFYFHSTPDLPALIQEIFGDNYHVLGSNIEFRPHDIILDLGANEGVFSILMAKLFPFTHIISLEPVPRTFYQMVRNIGLNGITNISPYNIGVGKEAGTVTMNISRDFSGGSSSVCTFVPADHIQANVNVSSLSDIFQLFIPDRCRLVKSDTEGAEYDTFYGSPTILSRIDYVTMEVHINSLLEIRGFRPDALVNWISNKTNLLYVECCKMAE
jgi:FkbM family methyltransferase